MTLSRRAKGVAAATAAVLVYGGSVAATCTCTLPVHHDRPTQYPKVFVSATGDDSGANCHRYSTGQQSVPSPNSSLCATLQKAYTLAAPGDVICWQPGTYSGQTLLPDTTNSKPGVATIVMKPCSTGSPSVFNGAVDFGTDGVTNGPDYLTFDGSSVTTINGRWASFYGGGGPGGTKQTHESLLNTHITDPSDLQGGLVFTRDPSYLTVSGNEIGPGCCNGDAVDVAVRSNGDPNPDHITFTDNYVHDVYDTCTQWPAYLGSCSGTGFGDGCGDCAHVDGMQPFGCAVCDISRNVFYLQGNHRQGLFLYPSNGGTFSDLTVANNFFTGTSDNTVSFSGDPGTAGDYTGFLHVYYNTIRGAMYVYDLQLATGTPVVIAGNIIEGRSGNSSGGGCSMLYSNSSTLTPTWASNLLGVNSPCGTGDVSGTATFVQGGFPGAVSCGTGATTGCVSTTGVPNLNLTGPQAAKDGGEATYCPATDVHGTTRPVGTACDIGADEAG